MGLVYTNRPLKVKVIVLITGILREKHLWIVHRIAKAKSSPHNRGKPAKLATAARFPANHWDFTDRLPAGAVQNTGRSQIKQAVFAES